MIYFDDSLQLFHAYNDGISIVLWVREDVHGLKEIQMPYVGAPLKHPQAALHPEDFRTRASFDSERQMLPYAVPTDGRGDFRPCMLRVAGPDGQTVMELGYTGSYQISKGKQPIPGLPSTHAEEGECETLALEMADALTGLKVMYRLTLFSALPAFTTSLEILNAGSMTLVLEKAASLTLSLSGEYDLMHFHGAWAREREAEQVRSASMTRRIESTRGASGHEHNPFVVLSTPGATEDYGQAFGVTLLYSGNFAMDTDMSAYRQTRLVAGINERGFRWNLEPGASFYTPEALCVFGRSGFTSMSQVMHEMIRCHVCRGRWTSRVRPVLINNWEATYFQFTHDRILEIARKAADLGVEMFVLDDGWFGHRNDDHSSLGDWVVNEKKLEGGLDRLSRNIHALGMKFGLWFEPEMVSPDSDLYRAHPDWCLHADGRARSEARNQLILDLSRREVQDYIISSVSTVLESTQIDYVKWDMNRNFAECGSAAPGARQGEVAHRYMLGLYRVLDAIVTRFPEVLFESCSGGGGRFDAGILSYMPQTWTSDDTDAVERLNIQWGTSFAYPACTMGAHVSTVPNHQVGRITPMKYRCEVAMGGNFGLELDLSAQSQEDLEEIRRQIARIKEIRSTLLFGRFIRLCSPADGQVTAWAFEDEERLILCAFRAHAHANRAMETIPMHHLDASRRYLDSEGREVCASDLLACGWRPALHMRDYASTVEVFRRIP